MNDLNNHSNLDSPQENTLKKPYSPPQLEVYGEIRSITLGTPTGGTDTLGEELP